MIYQNNSKKKVRIKTYYLSSKRRFSMKKLFVVSIALCILFLGCATTGGRMHGPIIGAFIRADYTSVPVHPNETLNVRSGDVVHCSADVGRDYEVEWYWNGKLRSTKRNMQFQPWKSGTLMLFVSNRRNARAKSHHDPPSEQRNQSEQRVPDSESAEWPINAK